MLWTLLPLALTAPFSTDDAVGTTRSRLTVSIGESIFALAARAPDLIHTEQMDDNSPAMLTRPVRIAVSVDRQVMQLPPTRFAMIEQAAGVITGVKTSPMFDFAPLEASMILAEGMAARAQASGWMVVESFPWTLPRLRADLARAGRPRFERTYAILHHGDAELRIYLKEESGDGRTPADRRLFLVNTDFQDRHLEDSQTGKLFARRRELTGGTSSVSLRASAAR